MCHNVTGGVCTCGVCGVCSVCACGVVVCAWVIDVVQNEVYVMSRVCDVMCA